MISVLFIVLASICNAVMDVCSHHFTKSIFTTSKKKIFGVNKHEWWRWWNASYSWRNKYVNDDPDYGRRKLGNTELNYPVQLTDAWHFFKTLMIVFIVLAIVFYTGHFYAKYRDLGLSPQLALIGEIIFYGASWNVFFSLFYKKILRK